MVKSGTERKTGSYFWEYFLTTKRRTLNRIPSRNFNTKKEAISWARERVKKGKWVQAELIFTKNILSDVQTGIGFDTSGKLYRRKLKKVM